MVIPRGGKVYPPPPTHPLTPQSLTERRDVTYANERTRSTYTLNAANAFFCQDHRELVYDFKTRPLIRISDEKCSLIAETTPAQPALRAYPPLLATLFPATSNEFAISLDPIAIFTLLSSRDFAFHGFLPVEWDHLAFDIALFYSII